MYIRDYLCEIAEENNIQIHYPRIGHFKSLIIKGDDASDIILDRVCLKNETEEIECLAHELGHFETGTYYKTSSPLDIIEKHEHKANKWSVENILPFCELKHAMVKGITEVWALAEFFNLSESFIKLSIKIYTQQGLLPINE